MRQNLTLITLGVKDIKKAEMFFEKLGWKKSSASMEEMIFYKLPGILLGLHPEHELAADAGVENDGKGFTGVTLSLNLADESEVNAALQRAENAGAEIIKPAQKVYWGGYSGYFRYERFLFEVAFNPFWKLDEEGNVILPD